MFTLIVLQVVFAVFFVISASYIGCLRIGISYAGDLQATINARGDVTGTVMSMGGEKSQGGYFSELFNKIKIRAVIFDLSMLGVLFLTCLFLHNYLLLIPLVLGYRLFYGCFLNFYEKLGFFALDKAKYLDKFIIKLLGTKNGGWIQVIFLVAAIVAFNILTL